MAEEDENENTNTNDGGADDGGGSKKKMLIIMILAFLVIVGGAVGAFFALSGGGEVPEETVEGEAVVPEGPPAEEKAAEADKKENPKEGEEPKAEGEAAKSEGGDPKAEGEAAKEDEEIPEEDFGFGKTFTFKTFRMNLGNPLQNHFIHLDVSVEYRNPKAEKELARRKSQLRDAVVSIVSNKTREFLLNPDGKEQLRLQILRRMNRYMKNKIEQVFITDIIIE